MHAKIIQSAKKKALSELIQQMRKLELKDGPEDEDAAPEDDESAEGDILEPDMSDLEDVEGSQGQLAEEDEEDDPKKLLKGFMKQTGNLPRRGRATVVVSVGKKSPAAQMKKTFGGK